MTALAEGELAKAAPPRFAESILPKINFMSIWSARAQKTVDQTLNGFCLQSEKRVISLFLIPSSIDPTHLGNW